MKKCIVSGSMALCLLWFAGVSSRAQQGISSPSDPLLMHCERPDDPYLPNPGSGTNTSPALSRFGALFFMTQVNVNEYGENILGDAANEPSIAIDPTNPDNMAMGWRQFDNVSSNFRQAGYGYTTDGGQTWTFPGVLEPGVFRSDPVLGYDVNGNFYYNSLTSQYSVFTCKVFQSADGGATWNAGVSAYGGDKQWMTIDRTTGVGTGHIYSFWTSYYSSCLPGFFTRSTDGGNSFEPCVFVSGNPFWGTMAVDQEGALYLVGSDGMNGIVVAKSTSAQYSGSAVSWDFDTPVNLDGTLGGWSPVNPEGLLGQAYVDVDRSTGPGQGNVYVLASVVRNSIWDPADVMFAKSTDGGMSWSSPIRINDDPWSNKYQWFGTMSVAPNGRIDVVWLDTRDAPAGTYLSALYYSFSEDQGETWSVNEPLSDLFDPHVGWPQQQKMGDYFDMISDETSAHLAWANTLNGEQDIYYGRITPQFTGISQEPSHQGSISLTCYPNPFRDQITIRYIVPEPCPVRIGIYTVYGKEVQTLVNTHHSSGLNSIHYVARELPEGYYLCRLTAGTRTVSTKLVRIK